MIPISENALKVIIAQRHSQEEVIPAEDEAFMEIAQRYSQMVRDELDIFFKENEFKEVEKTKIKQRNDSQWSFTLGSSCQDSKTFQTI
jgi:septum formation topological specificity factor MinE